MKSSYVAIIILVILVGGGVFFLGMNKQAGAPTVPEGDANPFPTGNSSGSESINPNAENPNEPVACTLDAKVCPDGSSVGRVAPDCEFAACPTASTAQPVKEFTVTGKNFSFTPSSLTVKKGDKVKITFKNDNGTHNFILDEFGVNTGLVPAGNEKTVEFTANKTGSFQYYCSVGSHRAMGMWGTLKVE
jgi:nitrosocyanin